MRAPRELEPSGELDLPAGERDGVLERSLAVRDNFDVGVPESGELDAWELLMTLLAGWVLGALMDVVGRSLVVLLELLLEEELELLLEDELLLDEAEATVCSSTAAALNISSMFSPPSTTSTSDSCSSSSLSSKTNLRIGEFSGNCSLNCWMYFVNSPAKQKLM